MRAKSVVYTRQRKKKWFRRAKGAYATKSTRWRMVIQHLEKSLKAMYRGRKDKKRDFRAIWIQRINAAARQNGMSYSQLVGGLKKAGVVLDRKVIAEIAATDLNSFQKLTDLARASISKTAV